MEENAPSTEPQAAAPEPTTEEAVEEAVEEVVTAADEPAGEAASGAAAGKRKRRRRKKRKDAVEGATAEGEGAAPDAVKRKESHAPFLRLFAGSHGAKRHAFSVGEVVAGRVQRVEHGVIVIDLFGKATAIVDEYEPREIPVIPDPSAAATPEAPAAVVAAVASSPQPVTFEPGEATLADAVAVTEADADIAAHEDEHDEAPESAPVVEVREKPEAPRLGQVMKGRVGAVSESGHIAILNRLVDGPAVRAQLDALRQEHKRVHGVVYGFNRGGFDVLVEGLRAFCPASAMALGEIPDPLEYVGKKLEFLLPASKSGGRDIIVSRRSILERLQRRKTKEFLKSITIGQRFKGRVTAVREFGLFVDIGDGVEGLVHQSELSYAFGVKPASVASAGDEVEVQVVKVGGDAKHESGRRERLMRVGLSMKALQADPWDEHSATLSDGNVVKGKVVRTTDFGAFVEVAKSIEGLLHISELGRDLKHASQALREGEEIHVAIDRVDRSSRRISLSKLSAAEVQQFEAGAFAQEAAVVRNLRQGADVKLKVEKVDPRCVHARVVGTVGRRGRAFIPSSETGTDRGSDLRKAFPPGSELDAKIIGIDRDGSLKCSVKALLIDQERQAIKNYRREASKQGFGTFGDLLRAKLGEASK